MRWPFLILAIWLGMAGTSAFAATAKKGKPRKPKPKVEKKETTSSGTIDWGLALGVQTRLFPSRAAYPGQNASLADFSGSLKPNFVWQSDDQRQKFELIPFFRYDVVDSERTHFDLREASFTHAWSAFELSVGFKNVFWGVTESQQLVNIMNQIDLVEDYRARHRLGQPMASLKWSSDWGVWSAYVATGFRERTFPGTAGRLRGDPAIDTDHPLYESEMKMWQPDVALRYQHTIDAVDFGIYQFHGTSREPDFVVSGTSIQPYYPLIDQTGLDAQVTSGALLTKLEAIFNARNQFRSSYFGMTGGFEYTFFQAFGTSADLGAIAEYSHDTRGELSTHLNRDIFAGLRLGLNDLDNTELLTGIIQNLQGKGGFLLLEASRRFGEQLSVAVSSAVFSTVTKNSTHPFTALRQDDHVGVTATYFFK